MPGGQGAAVVAVDDPGQPGQPLGQGAVEGFRRDVGAVGLVPEHIEIAERQAGGVPQGPRKGALARARTADDQNFLHGKDLL